ncbi:type II secretion system F family protein [Actinomycetospora endophytica]|uniref:Type II secretion system F family protein n=1 Tax=Actinomycetospora endophytica TaxID=2291215 RepID=A0ABS8P6B2_9PSEU|nr:type II secretion system F family protein [Actinomycetospora endophytica]MCD2193558.1 type II secretion system F family protein [Actinomycetospora endophytica]
MTGAQALPMVLAAAATLAWPPAVAPGRVRALRRAAPDDERRGWARIPVAVPAGAGLLIAVLVAGVGGAVAVCVLGAVLLRARAARRLERARTETTGGLAEGLAAFAAELRAGHPPASAAAAAGRDAGAACRGALTLVEATARLGGDVPAALREHAASDPLAGPHLVRLADAWSLADRHGIGLAGLAEAVAEDLRARSRFGGRLSAQLAGPRTTAAVLAALPGIGLVLGELVGAHPLGVLTGTAAGQGLLVVGAVLVAAGLEWSGRLTAGVVR